MILIGGAGYSLRDSKKKIKEGKSKKISFYISAGFPNYTRETPPPQTKNQKYN